MKLSRIWAVGFWYPICFLLGLSIGNPLVLFMVFVLWIICLVVFWLLVYQELN